MLEEALYRSSNRTISLGVQDKEKKTSPAFAYYHLKDSEQKRKRPLSRIHNAVSYLSPSKGCFVKGSVPHVVLQISISASLQTGSTKVTSLPANVHKTQSNFNKSHLE